MSGRYQRVNTHNEDEEPDRTSESVLRPARPTPDSPPPSFHSRASSTASRGRAEDVDPTLADAFDADGDDSDDEPDDRQRLMTRTSSFPANSSGGPSPQPGNASADEPDGWQPTTATRQDDEQAGGSANPFRIFGSGIQSDGVFSNLSAKPERGDGEKEELPPTYEQAAADAAPPYWETTILAPGLGGPDEVYIDGMPVGSIFSFVWNGMISMSFQVVGFLLTYLLHSTHAAKNGSRAGLGITLIQYGFYMKGTSSSPSGGGAGGMEASAAGGGGGDGYSTPSDPNSHDFDPNDATGGGGGGGGESGNGTLSDITSSDWIAYILMIVGWFVLIRAVSDYLKARRHEQLVLQSPDRGLGIPIIAEGEGAETVV